MTNLKNGPSHINAPKKTDGIKPDALNLAHFREHPEDFLRETLLRQPHSILRAARMGLLVAVNVAPVSSKSSIKLSDKESHQTTQ